MRRQKWRTIKIKHPFCTNKNVFKNKVGFWTIFVWSKDISKKFGFFYLPPKAFFSQALQLNLNGAYIHGIAPHLAYTFHSFVSFSPAYCFSPYTHSVKIYILSSLLWAINRTLLLNWPMSHLLLKQEQKNSDFWKNSKLPLERQIHFMVQVASYKGIETYALISICCLGTYNEIRKTGYRGKFCTLLQILQILANRKFNQILFYTRSLL